MTRKVTNVIALLVPENKKGSIMFLLAFDLCVTGNKKTHKHNTRMWDDFISEIEAKKIIPKND